MGPCTGKREIWICGFEQQLPSVNRGFAGPLAFADGASARRSVPGSGGFLVARAWPDRGALYRHLFRPGDFRRQRGPLRRRGAGNAPAWRLACAHQQRFPARTETAAGLLDDARLYLAFRRERIRPAPAQRARDRGLDRGHLPDHAAARGRALRPRLGFGPGLDAGRLGLQSSGATRTVPGLLYFAGRLVPGRSAAVRETGGRRGGPFPR